MPEWGLAWYFPGGHLADIRHLTVNDIIATVTLVKYGSRALDRKFDILVVNNLTLSIGHIDRNILESGLSDLNLYFRFCTAWGNGDIIGCKGISSQKK